MDTTLLKGLQILEALASSDASRGVSELARELGLTRSNVHRTLKTLCSAGYVRQSDSSDNYECTLKLFQLGGAVLARVNVRQVAEPQMEALAAKTRETVHLSVLDDTDVIYLSKIDSPQPVRAYSTVAGRAPAYAVATGKALLAFQPEGYAARFADRFEAFTPRTLVTISALQHEIETIRQQGYAINRGEWRESVGGLAAPIFDASRRAIAAVGISGPVERLKPAVLKSFTPDVVQAARSISRSLGYVAQ
ncbi:MAG TPA: IclR family transcriptional regulator [Burkholderiaceae bacterium]